MLQLRLPVLMLFTLTMIRFQATRARVTMKRDVQTELPTKSTPRVLTINSPVPTTTHTTNAPPTATTHTTNAPTSTMHTANTATISAPTSTVRQGCFQEGKWYLPGQEISRSFNGKNWCYGTRCDESGQILAWDNFNCGTTSSYPATTTSPPTTIPNTTPPGCFQEGRWYQPGQEISRGFDGKNWCYGSYCSQDGVVISWDNFNCGTTPPPSPTTIPKHPGCYYDGNWYEPGQEISRVMDSIGCHGSYCDHTGNIVAWNDWNCITTPQTTTTPSPLTTTVPNITPTPRQGCFYEGKWYRSGQEISRGFDGKNWCYGTYCDKSGHVAAWDDWKCGTTPTTTTPTPPPSSPPPPPGCFHRGQLYPSKSIILESTNGNGWCYGKRCTDDGQLVLWDDFTCFESKLSTGCDYGGHLYATGSELFRKTPSGCFGGMCESNGQIKAWTRLDCQSENLFHGGRLKPSWCKHRGVVYPRGSVFAVKSLFKRYGFGWCRGAKCVANGRIVAWGPKWAPGYC